MAWVVPVVAAVAAVVQAGISAIGQAQAAGEHEKARQLREELLREIRSIQDPDLKESAAQLLAESEAGGIKSDPEMVAAQKAVLSRLQDISDAGGLTLEDRAVLDDNLNKAARAEAANRNALSNQMQARGQLGGGAELAINLQSQQAGAQHGYENARDTAALAQRRALDALRGRGQLASQLRDQDYTERLTAAKARDEINKYNAAAQERALERNNAIRQQRFSNALAKASGSGQATNNLGDFHERAAQGERDYYVGLGTAAGSAVKGAGGYYNQQSKRPARDYDEEEYLSDGSGFYSD